MKCALNNTVKSLWADGDKIKIGKAIAGEMEKNLKEDDYFYTENYSERLSWENSIPELLEVLMMAGLADLNIILEYQSSIGNRMDAVIVGYDHKNKPLVLVVELKQWNKIISNRSSAHTEVCLCMGKELQYRQHPLSQVNFYKKSLKNHHSMIHNNNINVIAIAFLHNFIDKSTLFSNNYNHYKRLENNVFVKNERDKLIQNLSNLFQNKNSQKLAIEFLDGEYILGKTGLDGIKSVISNKENALMISDQNEINTRISKELNKFKKDQKSRLLVVKGGPGTGKTVLGLHILHYYMSTLTNNHDDALFTFAKSRTLSQVIVGEAGAMVPVLDEKNIKSKSLVIIDEAHRIENVERELDKYFNNNPKFILVLQDDKQRIRRRENGTYERFIEYTKTRNLPIFEEEFALTVQKRNGLFSDFVKNIDEFLYNPSVKYSDTKLGFDIQIDSSLHNIDEFLKKKIENGYTAKWYAAFSWPWSQDTNKNDIRIQSGAEYFEKPWNPMHNQHNWYKNSNYKSIDQVGCIYTAQGLDYDYTGLIWWDDLKWDNIQQQWVFDLDKNEDTFFKKQLEGSTVTSEEKLQLVLNTYRVLLTRAIRGTRIWFVNKETEEHFKRYFNID